MTLIDSSGWLEFFTDGPLAEKYSPYLSDLSQVLTPAVVLYEVYKRIRRERGEEDALVAAAQLKKTQIVPLTDTIAMRAAELSLEHHLAMADAMVYATATLHSVLLVTSDSDFAPDSVPLPGVVYYEKPAQA
ncbi:MAG TPA: type II toxin-antitoxin system VapC family toxin [Thermoanaerobaculia bacterium]|nr:type II toxin-antitoxin system VapC family toxin [Thermoanaerobaculia bacterium]